MFCSYPHCSEAPPPTPAALFLVLQFSLIFSLCGGRARFRAVTQAHFHMRARAGRHVRNLARSRTVPFCHSAATASLTWEGTGVCVHTDTDTSQNRKFILNLSPSALIRRAVLVHRRHVACGRNATRPAACERQSGGSLGKHGLSPVAELSG